MFPNRKVGIYCSTLFLCIPFHSSADGFFDFNVYPYLSDVDSDSAFTLNVAKKLPGRFSYFGFINLYGENRSGYLPGAISYYTEQNIRWQIAKDSPLDFTFQSNLRTGSKNNRHRLGIRWRLNNTKTFESFFKSINLSYAINLHAVQFDHEDPYVWQIEHAFMMRFPDISKRIYMAGFIDHTFNQDLPNGYPSSPIVGEVQFGFQLSSRLHAIAEYRINQYRRQDVNNLGVGLQYKINW